MNKSPKVCKKCGSEDFGTYTSSSTGKVFNYCRSCRRKRADQYTKRKSSSGASHSRKEWLQLLEKHLWCPRCRRKWSKIPPRPNKRYKYVWTKDHIKPLVHGGTDSIKNIQPLCYQCQFKKGSRIE